MESNKRHQSSQPVIQTHAEDPQVAGLCTVGMRIRKAVADGFSVPTDFQYQQDWHEKHYGTFDRVPLPNNLTQPPSLTNVGSTYQSSGSTLSCWNEPSPLQTISSPERKRKLDQPTMNDYIQRYGELKFDEQF